MAAYMKDQFPFLGVKATPRRAACRGLITQWLQDNDRRPMWPLLRGLWLEPEREFQYVACDYLARCRVERADLPQFYSLITTRSWWDSVDPLVKTIGRCALPADMLEWAADDNMWVRRVAVLHQLGRKSELDAQLLSTLIDHVIAPGQPHAQDFFIRKAVGWALRDYARTNPDWVREFVASRTQSGVLSKLSAREATKHLD